MGEPMNLMDVANNHAEAHHEQVLKRMAAKCDHVWNPISANPKTPNMSWDLGTIQRFAGNVELFVVDLRARKFDGL